MAHLVTKHLRRSAARLGAWALAGACLTGCSSQEEKGRMLGGLDDVALHLNLGDSVAAGYNAAGNNAAGGRAYARLLFENHDAYPSYAADNVAAWFPGARFVDRAKSGSTSEDVVYQTFDLPPADGGVLVTIYVGGNDFNDELTTMLNREETEVAIAAWEDLIDTAVHELRATYAQVAITLATIHEPTDRKLTIPEGMDAGFCATLSGLNALDEATKQRIFDNYLTFNDAIRARAAALSVEAVIDAERLFLGHGLNADAPWIDDDCAHLTDVGHHQLRAEAWRLLTE